MKNSLAHESVYNTVHIFFLKKDFYFVIAKGTSIHY